jgi:UDP-N-acetylglucosamine 4,6-dehydratase
MDKYDVRGKNVLITGSGSLATAAIDVLCDQCNKVVVYSRDEHKHRKLRERFAGKSNVRYIIGDILDHDKLSFAMYDAQVVIHTAALKMIESGFYSADSVVEVNVVGTMNVAKEAIRAGVDKALFISSDKASTPLNGLTYGLSKALAESVWLSYNNKSTRDSTKLFATRYGNVINSNNSFYDVLEKQKKDGVIKVTDPNMTRFYFTIQEAMTLNIHAIENGQGGEIFIPRLKSASVMDFVQAFAPGIGIDIVGKRGGTEKLAEEMIAEHEMGYTYASGNYLKIQPPFIGESGFGWDSSRQPEEPIKPFRYTSDSTDVERLSAEDLKRMVDVK